MRENTLRETTRISIVRDIHYISVVFKSNFPAYPLLNRFKIYIG